MMPSPSAWFIAAAAGLAIAPSAVLAQQSLKIVAVTQPIATMPQYVQVDVPLLKQGLQTKSNGRIEVTLASWPERNVNGPEVLRLVRSGQVDIGAAPLNTVSGDVPLLDIVDLAGLNPTIEQARKIADTLVPEANKELERFNTRILATFPYTAQVLFCREPVSSLADLKAKRVRTGGGSINDFVSAIGAIPVGIGFPEVYTALERGTVDCAITGTLSGNNAKWFEVTKGLYALTVAWSTSAYFVNLGWWNKLDAPTRDLITATMKEIEAKQWQLGADTTEEGIACNAGQAAGCKMGVVVDKRPMTATRPTPADSESVRRILSETILPAWVKRCGERCGELYNSAVAPISGVRFAAKP